LGLTQEKQSSEVRAQGRGVATQTLALGACGSSKVCCGMLACHMTTAWNGKIWCGAAWRAPLI